MEDPQLAALMVANAKKQALENTRAHWNRNHEQIVESTGTGEGPKQRRQDQNAHHLALQASMLKEAASSYQDNSQNASSSGPSSSYQSYPMQRGSTPQQAHQHQQHNMPYAASDVSSSAFGGSDNFSHISTGVETVQASNIRRAYNHHNYNTATYADSDVSSSFLNSDFSIPSVGAESDILIRHPTDYYANPHHEEVEQGGMVRLNLMDNNSDGSSSSNFSNDSEEDEDDDDDNHGIADTTMYPVSPLNQYGVIASPQQPQQNALTMVHMSANLVLPTVDSESEDDIFLFADQSPAESPITTFREEPLHFMNSSSPARQSMIPIPDTTTSGFTVTPTKYGGEDNLDNHQIYKNPTPTKTPKTSNTSRQQAVSNIIYQDSSDEEQTFDDDAVILIDRKNVTLSSDPLNDISHDTNNDISRFEDEPTTPEREPEFPICAEFSNWTKRNRTLLCLLISITFLTSILIVIRTITANNRAVQDNPPNLADTIILNRTDDDDFRIIIVNNTQEDNDDDGPATISTTPEPSVARTLPPIPVPVVTRPPTRRPTPQPTRHPTMRPTPRPTRITIPTQYPTIDPFGFNREQFLFQVATEVSSASRLLDEDTPQYRALTWMVNEDDPRILDPITSLGKGNDIAYYEQVIDRYVMALLYFSTGGPNWRLDYNFLSATSICEWNDGGAGSATEGVTCSTGGEKGYEIEEIVLDVNFLEGIIPKEIGHFSSLKKLTMGSNNLFGAIPTELGTLRELTYLGLQRNYLIGSIPAQIGGLTKLTSLVLHDTGLMGRVPSNFNKLSNLHLLFLEGTSLTGDLDSLFCNDQKYQMFYANCRGSPALVACSCCTHCCLENGGGCERQATSRSDNDGVLN